MNLTIRLVIFAAMPLVFSACACTTTHHDDPSRPQSCDAIIRANALPAGWKLLPASELPPTDKEPWWKENPQLLRGQDLESLDMPPGPPARLSYAWAAIYEKDECRVVIFCFTYPSPRAAARACDNLNRERSEDSLLGISKSRKNTVVFMDLDTDSPDHDFFVNHFKKIADPAPAPPPDPDSDSDSEN